MAAVTVNSYALVAVKERVVLREALPERRGFFDEIGIVTGLRPRESSFERTAVADAERPNLVNGH